MRPLTKIDKVALIVAGIVFAATTLLGWYVRLAVGGEEGRAAATSVFSMGIIVVIAIWATCSVIQMRRRRPI